MMRAVKAVSTYRGRDPREFTLFAFGGNGGIHAAALAEELQMKRVIVPAAAGVFSAVGLKHCRVLERQAREELGATGPVNVRWRAELRYAGQGFELPVELRPDATGSGEVQQIRERFEREYRRTYGHELKDAAIDFVALRVIATVPPQNPSAGFRLSRARSRASATQKRNAYFGKEHGVLSTPVIGRHELTSTPRRGPLIVEEYEGTTVVPPYAHATLDAHDNIVITLQDGVMALQEGGTDAS
jgi:N-methylhydantoinase A